MKRLVVLILASCGGGAPASVCDDMCDELVRTCSYEAFPTYESCLQGCAYDGEQGADLQGQLTCVEEAACDTFGIVECQHTYGP